jgi:hypothetical protein
MNSKSLLLPVVALLTLVSMQVNAAVVPVSFTHLTGTLSGGATGVFRADLSALPLTELASITIRDTGGNAGSPGIWSGFDLDAIRLSTDPCLINTATCAGAAASINVFDFVNGVLFSPGTMDPTGGFLNGPCLLGTTGGGCDFDDTVATLGTFDGLISGTGSGWLSMGRGGTLSFNLDPLLGLGGPLFMYVGEVGNNGETLRGAVNVSDLPAVVPVPAAVWLFGTALIGLVGIRKCRKAA